ncbi:MAG: hypothetical protein JSS74_07995 [Actinobacteria bacterium]|nr:hypothetical protein [Actinomycetota bacterium]
MNTIEDNTDNPSDDHRPFGFWLTAVDRLLAAEFATAFEDEGITRRDWRILNAVDGTVTTGRPLPDRKLHHLAGLGWVERGAEGWTLTADGTAAKARLASAVAEIRAKVADLLSPEEYAALAASLEKLARGLGYEEGKRLPRRAGRDRRAGAFGHGHSHGSGHEHRFAHAADHDHGECHRRPFGPGERFEHGPASHFEHGFDRAGFERGFDRAGFERGFDRAGFERDFDRAGFEHGFDRAGFERGFAGGRPGHAGHRGRRAPGRHLHIHLHD